MLRNLGTIVLLLLLATPLLAVAQGTGKIAGSVVDDLGDPLPGANVIIGETGLGAATDIDGNYFVIGIPVGQYTVTASFVGYQPQIIEGVQISSGYTTQQDFELGSDIQLEEVVVEYERPIIQKDAIGVPKVVTGDQIENLPVRGVASVAAIQSGVVSNGGSDDLFVRGGREQEVVYYVDGVKVTGNASVAVNQQAIQEQEMLIGTIPARYGDALSGIISITTKSGGNNFFGSVEAITSEVLDAYGYNLGSLNIGGPIVPGKASFFASVSGTYEGDRNPYGIDVPQLNDAAQASLDESFQVLRVVNGNGDIDYVTAPFEALNGADPADVLANPSSYDIVVPDGFSLDSQSGGPVLLDRSVTFTAEDFTTSADKNAPLEELTFNGNITLNPLSAVSLRLGGVYETSNRETYDFSNSLYNSDNFSNDERDTWRVFGTFRQRLADNAFYQVQAEYQNWDRVFYPQRFSSDLSDALFYGDIDHPSNAASLRYLGPDFTSRVGDGNLNPVGAAYNLFQQTGNYASNNGTFYQKQNESTLRFSGNATTQLGVHQVEFGAEFEQQTRRFFSIGAASLATFYNGQGSIADDEIEGDTDEGVSSYDQLEYRDIERLVNYYGYSFNGLEEVNDQNVEAFASGDNTDVAPYKPIYYAGYIQDKIEFRDLIINLGLRADVFDNNTLVLKDIFAPFPIRRAGDLVNPDNDFFVSGFGLPTGIEADYAVYFGNVNDPNTLVGFRDLDGTFYDRDGNEVAETDIESIGQVSLLGADRSVRPEMFEDYEPQVTFMPRVGVSFPVTDRALFFASYNVTSQRPTERSFTPFSNYNQLTNTTLSNPNLKPEKTTQYELGFRQRVGERAALTLSGFYRTQDDKISIRNLDQIGSDGSNSFTSYLNVDRTTAKGVELAFDLRRTNNVSINANYTLSFAQGTGSDSRSASTIAWLGGELPNVIFPTDFDRRHTGNFSIDYRLGEDEGPMIGGAHLLENFGINFLGRFQSGLPYSPTVETGDVRVSSNALDLAGDLNSARLPGSTTIDLRVDRRFELGFAAFKAYVWVQNLLDTESPLTVYQTTGQPETSGFLNTSGGLQEINNASVATGAPDSFLYHYQQFEGGPVYEGSLGATSSGAGNVFYAPPRRIRLGILLNF